MAQNNTNNSVEQDLNEILRLRREKLANLKESGNDPYTITKFDFDNDSKNIKVAGTVLGTRRLDKRKKVRTVPPLCAQLSNRPDEGARPARPTPLNNWGRWPRDTTGLPKVMCRASSGLCTAV